MGDPVVLSDYDSNWLIVFGQLRDRLQACLGALAVAIEHIGSTSVPGLVAKPIIDIDVAVDTSDTNVVLAIERLTTIGYIHEGNLGILGREAMRSPKEQPPNHLYVCRSDNTEYLRHLTFRNYLRTNPDAVQNYAALKKTAAVAFRDDRVAYGNAKNDFIESSLEKAARIS